MLRSTLDPKPALARRIEAVRRFNRTYTRRIGVLTEGYLGSGLSLVEVRVLFELAHRPQASAKVLARDLNLDAGYLSRILRSFERRGFITRRAAAGDARVRRLSLTRKGSDVFRRLDRQAAHQVAGLLGPLDESQQDRLVGAMTAIETLMSSSSAPTAVVLRQPRPGDMGWVIQLHGALYAREYGWDERFEALVGEIVVGFMKNQDPRRERCCIAQVDGENVGCIFCVRKSKQVAQLRLLLVDPKARGMALGTRLVAECIDFARSAGYRRMMLWTNDVLHAARRIYEKAGFKLVREEKHHSFGHDLVGQFWEMAL